MSTSGGAVGSVARAGLLGLAVGGRTTAALAALTLTSGRADPRWLRSRPALVLSLAGALGEGIGDQLPSAPSRLDPSGLIPRLALGALGGALLGGRRRGSVPLGAAVGLTGAFAGSHLGSRWRTLAAGRFGNDHPGAFIEDAAVIALAAAATR